MFLRLITLRSEPDLSIVILYLYITTEYKVINLLNKVASLSEIDVDDILCKIVVEFESGHSYFKKGLNRLCNKTN